MTDELQVIAICNGWLGKSRAESVQQFWQRHLDRCRSGTTPQFCLAITENRSATSDIKVTRITTSSYNFYQMFRVRTIPVETDSTCFCKPKLAKTSIQNISNVRRHAVLSRGCREKEETFLKTKLMKRQETPKRRHWFRKDGDRALNWSAPEKP